MGKETQLNKSFKETDLSRIRNLIEGKYGDKTKIQIGYSKKHIEYKEGDVFNEDGKTYTIKDGIKQNITKLDSIKNLIKFPLKCPCCNKPMKNTELNQKMYRIHTTCFNCVIEKETKLKLEGKFGEYEKEFLNKNKNSHLNEFEKALDNYSNSIKETYMTEDGEEVRWVGNGVDMEWVNSMREYIKELKQ